MSRAICPKCGGTDVSWIRNDADYAQYVCLECKQDFYYPPKTIFHQITASPEMLAKSSVYCLSSDLCRTDDGKFTVKRNWKSPFIDRCYDTEEEAFTATVAKLNSSTEIEGKDE